MAGSDWAAALGAALQQFGSNYTDFSRTREAQRRTQLEEEQVKAALARDETRYREARAREAKQDEMAWARDYMENAPYEAPLGEADAARLKGAGYGGRIGERAATTTNIPSQFMMEGGAAQTADPGTFLRATPAQELAQLNLRRNDPSVLRQQEIDKDAREAAEWTRRNEITARQAADQQKRQLDAYAAMNTEKVRDPGLALAASLGPSLAAQGVPPEQIPEVIQNILTQLKPGGGQAPTNSLSQFGELVPQGTTPETLAQLADLDNDIAKAGSVSNYLRDLLQPQTQAQLRASNVDVRALAKAAQQRIRTQPIAHLTLP